MINRNLLRIKIIQVLYSYYKNNKEENDFDVAQNELTFSIDKTYELYHYFFQLIVNVTDYAEARLNKRRISETEHRLNQKLANNQFAQQLKRNIALQNYLEEHDVNWHLDSSEAIKNIYNQIMQSEYFEEYASKAETSYSDDKELWRTIFKKTISDSELLGDELEDLSIYWNDDAEIVISFVIKTIKHFEKENGDEQELMPKFKDSEDEKYAYTLFKKSIYNAADYKELIAKHTKNWDSDRIAFVDTLIMQTALAEICSFPSIPVSVSINEYLELAKVYSTPRSSVFINGVLDAIVKELTNEKKITKVAYTNSYKK